MERTLLTTKEASTLTGMSVAWFEQKRWLGTEQPPYIRIGRSVRYDRKTLLGWCKARQVAPGKGA